MKCLVSATTDIKFHQIPDGVIRHNYLSNNKETAINSVSWKNDGAQLAVVPTRGFTEIVNFDSSVRLLKTISQVYLPNCATFQNKGNTDIAIGTLSGQVILYDIENDCVKHRFPTAVSSIFQLKYNNEDTHLAAACSNGDVLLYSDFSSTLTSSFRIPKYSSVSTVCFNGTRSNLLGAGSEEGDVVVWDINNNSVLCNYLAHHSFVTCVAFSSTTPDLLLSSGLDQKFIFHDIRIKKTIAKIKVENSITTFDICNFDNYIGLGSQNGNVLLYDSRNLKKPVSTFVGHREKKIRHLLFQKGVLWNETKTQDTVESVGEKSNRIQCDKSLDSFLIAVNNLNSTRGLDMSRSRLTFNEEERVSYTNLSAAQKPNTSAGWSFSSTPITPTEEQELSPSLSAIEREATSERIVVSTEELKKIIKEIVKEELENYVKICNEELKHNCKEMFDELRTSILKIQVNLLMKFNETRKSLEELLLK